MSLPNNRRYFIPEGVDLLDSAVVIAPTQHAHFHTHPGHPDRNPDGYCYTHGHAGHPDRPATGCKFNLGGTYAGADDTVAHAHAYGGTHPVHRHNHTHNDQEKEVR